MFNSSYQNLSFRQQIISTSQSYPCPRCNTGLLEPHGLTECLNCSSCQRSFVALRGGRLLTPATRLGFKIAPTFWWDGLRWHWAGTTASTRQLFAMVLLFTLPILACQAAFQMNLFQDRPEWLSPALASAVIGLFAIQTIYFLCWDYDFVSKHKDREKRTALSDRPSQN
ncbi:MAG: hypothetical protein LCH63_09350 [Candidatus Melainabacteria bacterium]|uniref:Uncharacterized protein n=1 Tax=Candidatus Obscuribacter phosphatis TaxID=1906157 RepID=A0A8J7TMB0_9BACT|nr:hypothetical protein [Candidatus Obscuribacter phosphatis]MCA0314030.1 hypothetical protein [Candidatus Melainabacteria bacterium]